MWAPATTLSDRIHSRYIGGLSIICDMGGAEAEIPRHDAAALRGSRQLIIEFYDTRAGGEGVGSIDMSEELEGEPEFELRAS